MKYLIGIQPTGKLHIGNYLGCVAKGLRLQEDNEVTFLIANYHSLTTDSFSEVTEQELIKLGANKIVHQTPEYTELFFKLCCKMNLGSLTRMPQYKDKAKSSEYDLGLLLYPVLMSADIIINDPDIIIIGRDQVQHIELCNDICKRVGVNKEFKYEFGDVDKVMSLRNPMVKMSKSLPDSHVLYIYDDHYSKLKSAVTTPEGLNNLITIANYFDIPYKGNNQEFKEHLAERLSSRFL